MDSTPHSNDRPLSNGRIRRTYAVEPNRGDDIHALPHDLLAALDPLVLLDIVGPRHIGDQEISAPEQAFAGLHLLTFVFRGSVEHHDSLGNHDVVSAGGLLYLRAGAGVVQQEVLRGDGNGIVHIIRAGIRMPPDQELDQWPPYWHLVPEVLDHPERSEVEHLVSGWSGNAKVRETLGPIKIPNLHDMSLRRLHPGGSSGVLEWIIPDLRDDSIIVVVDGSVVLSNGERLTQGAIVVVADEGPALDIVSPNGAMLLKLSGTSFGTPLAADFGFVMSDEDELLRAWEDYAAGRMGRVSANG